MPLHGGLRLEHRNGGEDTNIQSTAEIASLEGYKLYFILRKVVISLVVRAINASLWIKFYLEFFNPMEAGLACKALWLVCPLVF